MADRGSDECRSAADHSECQQESPTRQDPLTVRIGLTGERRDDAEALRRVVQRKADHQKCRQRDLVRRGGLTDRQTFGEVVQADADRDESAS